ncbi:MAG: hypothetical protein JSV16_06565, partial [Candidatus Hydrogenedentota bacterium]
MEDRTVKESVSDRKSHGIVIFVLIVIVALLSLSNIPLVYAYLNQPSHLKFMGIIAGVRDVNYYFMMMQANGWCPILNNYFATGEPNAIYHGFFWFFSGKVGDILHVGNLAVYHGARIVATVIFVLASYCFVSRFLCSTAERVAALAMLSFGAGAGWVQMIWYHRTGNLPFVPADVGTPEASSFFTLMTFPHLSVALILIVLCFALLEASVSEGKMWLAAVGGVCGLVLGFIHAVNLIVIYAGVASFALISLIFLKETRPVRSAIVFGTFSVWPVAYYLYLILVRPELLPRVPVRSPAPLAYLIGFAPFVILSLVHVAGLIRTRMLPRGDLLLSCWAVTNSLMLYSYPLLSQEGRAVLGLQIPLVVLSSRAVFGTVLPLLGLDWEGDNRSSKKIPGVVVATLIISFTFPSTLYNISERVSRLKRYPEAFSLTRDEYNALDFL